MKHIFTVPFANGGQRLDVFLAFSLPHITRSHIAKLLKASAGSVNGKTTTVHTFLKTNDVVEFDDAQTRVPVKIHAEAKKHTSHPAIPLIDTNKNFFVIDKPIGILSHPDANVSEGTVVDEMILRDPSIAKVGEDPARAGIVHRLDKDVSGLMVIARTQAGYDSLKKQFAEHTTEKTYLALVHGVIKKDEGDIKFRIARSSTKARMAARPTQETEGKAAWTHYVVVKRFHHATLLRLQIISGRTHQIRAHVFALGYPIFGDTLYTRVGISKKFLAPRLLLQCVGLSFADPDTGDEHAYTLPPDPAFEQVMKQLS